MVYLRLQISELLIFLLDDVVSVLDLIGHAGLDSIDLLFCLSFVLFSQIRLDLVLKLKYLGLESFL